MNKSVRWTYFHYLAVGLCLLGFASAWLIADQVLDQVPHLEDEVAYLFQARVFSIGRAYTRAVFHPNCFFAPFVLDHQGRRFGKYPPGWPALLALGVWMGQPWWVNAACAALTIALTFRLGCEIADAQTAGLAAALLLISPFTLLLSASLMSHTACLVFTTAFLWCFKRSLSAAPRVRIKWAWAGGVVLGFAFTIRPYSSVAIAVPAVGYALWRWFDAVHQTKSDEWRRLWWMGLGFAPLALIVPLFNAIWTGDPLLSPYVLFWPYDRVGFGPGHGPLPEGNTLWVGLGEAVLVVARLANWLHGWPGLSLIFVVAGFLFRPRRFWDVFLAGVALALILAFVLYWTNGNLYGPRYTFEAASALFILSAKGMRSSWQWVAAQTEKRWMRRGLAVALALLVAFDLFVYLPWQFRAYHGLFGITGRSKEILERADLGRALVIVRTRERGWKDYAVAFSMNAPTLDGDVVYASECPPYTAQLIARFPGRAVYYFDGETVLPLGERVSGSP